jgi:hypothetical protein
MSKPPSLPGLIVNPRPPEKSVTTPPFGDGVPLTPPISASRLVFRLIANSVESVAPATLRS